MRILLPVHHFPPTFNAGAELYTLRLGKRLRALGHEVEVVAMEAIDRGKPDTLDVEMRPYNGLPVWRLTMNLIAAPERLTWNFDNPLLEAWFDEHLARNRPDVIHFQAGYLLGVAPLRAAHKAAIPSVLTLHDYWLLCPRHTLLRGDGSLCEQVPESPATCSWCIAQTSRRVRIADRMTAGVFGAAMRQWGMQAQTEAQSLRRTTIAEAVSWPQVLIAPSDYLASRMQVLGVGERLRVLPYGIEKCSNSQSGSGHTSIGPVGAGTYNASANGASAQTAKLVPAPQRTPATLRVGYLGQVAQHKGVHLLLKAWQGLSGSQPRELHIHGSTTDHIYAQHLRALAGNDLTIHFHGSFDAGQRDSILHNLDVCVVPSMWFENRPFAIAEAHAAGVPVITSRLGGMEEMVRDGVDGLHFTPSNVEDLTRTIQRLLDDPALLRRLQDGARTARQLSVEEEVALLLGIYEEVTATKHMPVQSISG